MYCSLFCYLKLKPDLYCNRFDSLENLHPSVSILAIILLRSVRLPGIPYCAREWRCKIINLAEMTSLQLKWLPQLSLTCDEIKFVDSKTIFCRVCESSFEARQKGQVKRVPTNGQVCRVSKTQAKFASEEEQLFRRLFQDTRKEVQVV